ncbi:hypothetical protein BGW36DRAFT_441201 [Talaromyces proteolyticus]|uniref:Uncharacterized protein n=1 Tax=Talaromyces proteolyticus TaxID=1131652 RepID=A0AAD4PV66_9EURO|nr:uncharacterized protein BGW36DRAFT_441201 [Talaromyces proteolyticus]KAH8690296.1 hypothetical protein BGW36DRAFT_441201 [Talaromyces proteolyticus]
MAIDMWTLDALHSLRFLGNTLKKPKVPIYQALFEGFMSDQDHVIAEMISALGPLPKRWWDKWQ